jgi:hypothetical protein
VVDLELIITEHIEKSVKAIQPASRMIMMMNVVMMIMMMMKVMKMIIMTVM